MKTSTAFIINPASGFGKTKKNFKTLLKEIKDLAPKAEVMLTRHPLHAAGLAKVAIKNGARRLVVVGGDGTLNEVVNGCFESCGRPINQEISLAIIPSGTGSDFAKSLHNHGDLRASLEHALNGEASLIDVGLVEARDEHLRPVSRYFINVSSMGLSGLVAGFMKTVTKKLGPKAAYFWATIQAIRVFKPQTIAMSINDEEQIFDNCSLVSLANGSYFGSGMHIAPAARIDDGLLDMIAVNDLNLGFFLLNGYRLYQGTHVHLANVTSRNVTTCQMSSTNGAPIYIETDGELFAQLPAKYSIKPNALMMVR